MDEAVLGEFRTSVYATFAREGRAPGVAELSRLHRQSAKATRRALRELARRHLLVLDRDGDTIRMAHPFSAAPMAFVVTPADGHDDRRWWGGCAWDSFGISACLDLPVRIDTACPECGRPLRVAAGPATPPAADLVVRFPHPARDWWRDVVATCTAIRLFCTADHARRWSAGRAATGEIVPARTVWQLSQPWYGDRLASDYRPHTTEHNQRLLAAVGLTGPFWHLP